MQESIGNPTFVTLFIVVILFLLSLDLGVFQRKAHAVSTREALIWSIVWVALSLSFGTWIYIHFGSKAGLEFFAGYLIEYALSVDNIFVFILLFSYFSVPRHLHHRVLFWGILGALVMRATFILAGSLLLDAFHWVVYVFGLFLVFTGLKILKHGESKVEPDRNPVVRLFQKLIPLDGTYGRGGFIARNNGKLVATPLALVLVTVETTDLVFAVDSIPAIFAVTSDPFIVYTSNVCAILGLRSMYFLLANVVGKFAYLGTGLGIVLMFVGMKMLISDIYKIPIAVSLGIVAAVLTGSVVLSLLFPKPSQPSIPHTPLVTSELEEE
jgi:tellurite resistance protein TerC